MLEVADLHVSYEGKEVLHGVDFLLEQGQILCLLGPSGCGKTTLLRAIAGLEPVSAGTISLYGQQIQSLPVHKRDFGLMFQEFALFPHMTVEENVRFGLRMRGSEDQEQRVDEVLSLVGMGDFRGRDVTMLSGGERQRVALARSLAPNPRLLMLDEPLGSLDAALRERLIVDLREIIKHVGLTAIYVTHDQQEAFAIADWIAVMHSGSILQISRPETLYHHPETEIVARFLGLKNILPIIEWNQGSGVTDLGMFSASAGAKAILLHPDEITLSNSGDISGQVVSRIFAGNVYRLTARCGRNVLLHWLIPSHSECVPNVGDTVKLFIDRQQALSLY